MKEKIEEQVKTPAGRLRYDFGWRLEGGWTEDEVSVIREAASRVAEFIHQLTGGDGAAWVNSYLPVILTQPSVPIILLFTWRVRAGRKAPGLTPSWSTLN